MNKIAYSFLIILFCFSNILAIQEVDPSYYSMLLISVRRETVNTALTGIPAKKTIDYNMFLEKMVDLRDHYRLSDLEVAYLAYKWIAQNIEVQYDLRNTNYPVNVYDSGKGNPSGIASLFNAICKNFNITSGSIEGTVKVIKKFNYNDMISEVQSTWNYLEFYGLKYLVDVSLGAGNYNERIFEKGYSDFYFGTKPKYFIYRHFPSDSNYQLIPVPKRQSEFDSYPFVNYAFFLYGFKEFDPRDKEIKNIEGDIEVEIKYDPFTTDGNILSKLIDQTHSYKADAILQKNPGYEIEIDVYNLNTKLVYLELSIEIDNLKTVPILIYKITS